MDKKYEFDGPKGKVSLLDLFEGRPQLIVYRAFFEPGVFGWPEHACRGCSLGADQVAHLAHLNARDTTLAYASRAPQADIARLKSRMGWEMPWYTITDGFDKDFGVDEWHGHNVFFRDGDRVFRTYFTNNRGDEAMGSTWSYLDLTPLGRQETWEDSPEGYPQTPPYKWWNWHDNYDQGPRLTRSGSRCPTREKPPSENPTQRRKRAKELLLHWKVIQRCHIGGRRRIAAVEFSVRTIANASTLIRLVMLVANDSRDVQNHCLGLNHRTRNGGISIRCTRSRQVRYR